MSTEKATKETKVLDLKGNEVERKVFKLPVADANNFLNILGILLVGDDRLQPSQHHFVEMLKRNDEDNSE